MEDITAENMRMVSFKVKCSALLDIKTAAEAGYSMVTIGYITEVAKEELEKRGFTVKRYSDTHQRDAETTISW